MTTNKFAQSLFKQLATMPDNRTVVVEGNSKRQYRTRPKGDTQNGVTRPTLHCGHKYGGVTFHIWYTLDSWAMQGKQPQIADLIQHGKQHGWDILTIRNQFYRWRKFNKQS